MSATTDALVHGFDADHTDRTAEELRRLLGGKGAGLAAMTTMGLPVPPGFTLTTVACRRHLATGWDDALDEAVRSGLADLERATGTRLGDPVSPLLVSVRSGAEVSMPGMMDTVLDVGLTAEVEHGLARRSGEPGFVRDTRARAEKSWTAVVGGSRPTRPTEQVMAAVRAVFESWDAPRARRYRDVEGIPHDLGTAVTVQAMVFGNRNPRSGTGVAFTRNPSSGAPGLMGDFLIAAQGEDVVAGARPTQPLGLLRDRWPALWDELHDIGTRLERHFADMVDIELTIDDGHLWILQARRAMRSPIAALRVAIDMAEDPSFPLDRAGAVARCQTLLDDPPGSWGRAGDGVGYDGDAVVARGLAAVPGRAVGVLCCDVDRAVQLEVQGVDVILVRRETSPADVHGMAAARGLVTTLGGMVSHAAVVARSWGLPAVVGAEELRLVPGGVDGPGGHIDEGEIVTVDGDGGRLLRGAHPEERSQPPAELEILRGWSTET